MYGYLIYDTAFTLAFYFAVGSPSAPFLKLMTHAYTLHDVTVLMSLPVLVLYVSRVLMLYCEVIHAAEHAFVPHHIM